MSDARRHTLGASVRGPRHVATGKPNQDAIALRDASPQTIAVADGHGDARCTRSDIGAAIAVAVAIDVAATFEDAAFDDAALRSVLADAIVDEWSKRVNAHLDVHPLAAHEAMPPGRYPPLFAYGSTLVAAFAREDRAIAFQIGDGDLLLYDGGVRRVFARDERYAAHETTSLCQLDARAEVHVARLQLGTSALLLAATDGYANSFASDTDFTRIASDFHELIATHGNAAVLEKLPGMLETTTREGSGDDISVAILTGRDGPKTSG